MTVACVTCIIWQEEGQDSSEGIIVHEVPLHKPTLPAARIKHVCMLRHMSHQGSIPSGAGLHVLLCA